jgi:hypothetical protein
MMWPTRDARRPAPLYRDSRQSRSASRDLFAAFSCGGFSLLDSGRAGIAGAESAVLTARLRCVTGAFEFEDRTDALLPGNRAAV